MTAADGNGFRLSPLQERLWERIQAEDGMPYACRTDTRIEGPLNEALFFFALEYVVEENEIFRTTFRTPPGMTTPLQYIHDRLDPGQGYLDTSKLDPERGRQVAAELFDRCMERRFDLASGPLLRAFLVRLGPGVHLLHLAVPAICGDLQSLKLLVRMLGHQYRALGEGSEPMEAAMQYADVAEWLHELLDSEETLDGREYWHQREIASLPAGKLSLEQLQPAADVFHSRQVAVPLSSGISDHLPPGQGETGPNLRTLMLACWQILLFRHAGDEEVAVGVGHEGRKFEDLEGVFGLFDTYLPLFVGFDRHTTFRELLALSESTLAEFHEYQEYFDWSIVESGKKSANPNPCPYAYSYTETEDSFEAGDLRFSLEGFSGRVQRFKLWLSVMVAEGRPSLTLAYDATVFTGQAAAILGKQLNAILKVAVAEGDMQVANFDLLDEAERHRLVHRFNYSRRDYPESDSILSLFERCAFRHPHRVAVVFDGEGGERTLTYRGLNEHANRLAGHLKGMGVTSGQLIGLCLERSTEMVAGVLGILKSGAAYVPLDPAYPRERLAFMVADAQLPLIVTTLRFGEAFPRHRLFRFDSEDGDLAGRQSANPGLAEFGGQLLYMIYTSGSTGRPKGVMVSRRAAGNHMSWMREAFDFGENDKILQKAPLSFDASAWELFVPLISGSQLVMARPGAQGDPDYLVETVARLGIDTLQMVPSLLSSMLESGSMARDFRLRYLFCAGEALPVSLQRRVLEELDVDVFCNMYGPTEAAIDVTYWHEREILHYATVPIGRPVANTRVYLVDPAMAPVAVGIDGKLLLGGAGLARGYFAKPALTAEKFLPDPFSGNPGNRLYDSGDLAVHLPQDCLKFTGRIDHQVKIRGFRIELGEIQTVQNRHPGVADSLVTAHQEAASHQLVSYLIPDAVQARALHELLRLRESAELGDLPTCELPNGMAVFHQHENVTEYAYDEIFEQQCYLRNGITIEDGDCVFDIGANIGLFTLFAAGAAERVRIFSFEPIPEVSALARLNARIYAADAEVFSMGLAAEVGEDAFTYYPTISTFSSRFSDASSTEERAIHEAVLRNTLGKERLDGDRLERLLRERFDSESVVCPLTTLSTVIAEHAVDRIDLLKIDVEKSEWEVLAGIEEADWPKIKQIVLEVHDSDGSLARIASLLRNRGFEVSIEQETYLRGTVLHNVFATRAGTGARIAAAKSKHRRWHASRELVEDVRAFLSERLPDYMLPSQFMLLNAFPRTPNGKIDLKALPAPEPMVSKQAHIPPVTATQILLARIWEDLLDFKPVGLRSQFFELGGHSLLATQAISRARKAFEIDLPIQTLFEHPTIEELAAFIDSRGEEGRRPILPLLPVPRDRPLPVSYAQQRLWLTDQVEGSGAAYNVAIPVTIHGELDRETLARAANEIVFLHEILRTTFRQIGSEVYQLIADPVPFEVPCEDLGHLIRGKSQAEKSRIVEGMVGNEMERPFDLTRGPLYRVSLVRLGPREHLLQWTMHHIICDGWSLDILLRDFRSLYEAFSRGAPSPLADLTIQYADFSYWQRQWLQGEVLNTQLSFWKRTLAGLAPLLELPLDFPRPAVRSYRGDRIGLFVAKETADRLNAMGKRTGITLYMTLLATLKVMLARYTGVTDIAVGSPIANRTRTDLEGLVGFFTNLLILRDQVPMGTAFQSFLASLKTNTLSAFDHQDIPFEQVLESVNPVRTLNFAPFCQVVCVMQNTPLAEFQLPGLEMEVVDRQKTLVLFELTLVFMETDKGLTVYFDYCTDLFRADTIHRMAGHFRTLLESIAAGPERRLADLPMLTEAERERVLVDWNRTEAVFPADPTLHGLFAKRAARDPEAVAVVLPGEVRTDRLSACREFGGGRSERVLTYGALDRASDLLARSLRDRGISMEDRVGIFLERSPRMVAGLLATLKAGAAYLPLDPDYPDARLGFMLDDAQARVVLTHSVWMDRLAGRDCIRLDRVDPTDGTAFSLPEAPNPNGSGLAYLIYTSGSTGKPKAVSIAHRSAVNHMLWMHETFGFDARDRILQKAPLSFDASVWECFAPLLTGACLVLARPGGHRDSDYLVETCQRNRISVIQTVPSQLAALYEHEGFASVDSLRLLFCAGEALSPALQRRWAEAGPALQLCNMYGPTEATIDATFWLADREREQGRVPIGTPLRNCRIYLLDKVLSPVPIGVVGRLMIGGHGLARGYHGRQRLTAERFSPDPFASLPGSRLYETGDLGRYLADGLIDFIGRGDRQVKLRGFRIELGEIRAVQNGHPGVGDSLVVAQAEAESQSLVSYVLPDAVRARSLRELLRLRESGELDGHASCRLPNGMVVVHQHDNVTEYAYREIFDQRCYLRNGIDIRDGDCIFDVGANIGLFTLFAAQAASGVRIFSFEPIPEVSELAQINARIYAPNATVFGMGMAAEPGRDSFTYFPNISTFSSRFSDAASSEERSIYEVVLRNTFGEDQELSEEEMERLMRERLEAKSVTCRLTTVSTVMREQGLDRIDLLKIDVEKSELEVLAGIDEADWPKIRQIVLEVHDADGALEKVGSLLRRAGFEVAVEQEATLRGTVLYNVFGTRPDFRPRNRAGIPSEREWYGEDTLVRDLRAHLSERLPEYMVPNHFMVVGGFPRSPSGKIDLNGLPKPLAAVSSREHRPPVTPTQTLLAQIWEELLDHRPVGLQSHFFELGGHSLIATQAISRARKALEIELPIQALFEHPTVEELAGYIDSHAGERRGPVLPLLPVSRNQPLPVSYAQQRLWLTDQVEGSGAAYNVTIAVVMRGDLDREVLERAVNAIVSRHELLRTGFQQDGSDVYQIIKEPTPFAVPSDDLSHKLRGKTEDEKTRMLRRLVVNEMERPFDLTRGPLYRVGLLQLGPGEHLFQWSMHHIVCDGWSLAILLADFRALYEAFATGAPSPLPELPVQYADFAYWQRRWLQGEVLSEQLSFWKRRLRGMAPLLELPLDYPRPSVRSYRGARIGLAVGRNTIDRLNALGRETGATLYMILSAALKIVLARYTGNPDVSVGAPVANRTRTDLERLLGFFANLLILRDKVPAGSSFKTFLAELKTSTLQAFDHQDVPFEQIVEMLKPERTLNYTPFCQVVCVMQNTPMGEFELPGLDLEILGGEKTQAIFDLTLALLETERGLTVNFDYCTDLFKAETVQRMANHFRTLLESIAADPERRVCDLAMLTAAEREQILVDWNRTEAPYPGEPTLHGYFAECALRVPEAVAVVLPAERRDERLAACRELGGGPMERVLTYAALDRSSSRLARHLRHRGVSLEDRVGICLERSPQMVVGLLAILKAGAAYLPLDPDYPEARLGFMLDDAQARLVLTHSVWAERLSGRDCVLLDRLDGQDSPEPMLPEVPHLNGRGLAYLIYTSGSTGRPKAVSIEHRSAVNHMLWMLETFGFDTHDKILQKAAMSFDASVWECFAPLLTGACLVLARPGGHRDADYLVETCGRNRVTVLQMVPSQLAALYEHEGFASLNSLRLLFCAGETLPLTLQRRWAETGPSRQLCNMYGPTEATIDATYWLAGREHAYRTVPIGTPLRNCRIYILDQAMNPVPAGIRGRLTIGGHGLARAYLGRRRLTAERLIPDPFANRPGSRLYDSGDLARYFADGRIEFLGRVDHQVKLRGFRIELGEIEAELSGHPLIRQALVTPRISQGDSDSLVAYYLPQSARNGEAIHPDGPEWGQELRRHLAGRLPEFMVPAHFVAMEAWPLSPSGKIDRQALPGVTLAVKGSENFVAPRTRVETQLAEIWKELLGLDRVSVTTDFFNIGGHSLLATRVITRARKAFQIELPIQALFEESTIAGLAGRVERAMAKGKKRALPLSPSPRVGNIPLSYAQQRLWVQAQMGGADTRYSMPTALVAGGPLDAAALARALRECVERHESLRTSFTEVDGTPFQIVNESVAFQVPLVDLTGLPENVRARTLADLARGDARRAFHFRDDPSLFRASLIRTNPRGHALLVNMHHIVSDGWSIQLLQADMAALYRDFQSGREPSLAPLPIQYVDYAYWQRQWLTEEALQEHLAYWLEKLEGAPPLIALPLKAPRSDRARPLSRSLDIRLEKPLCAALSQLGRDQGVTLFMTLLTAFQVVLRYHGKREDLIVGTDVANRTRPELEGIVGFFVNQLVLRTDLGGNPSLQQLLARVRRTALDAYDHQDLPFDSLVAALKPERILGSSPLFQVKFVLQNPNTAVSGDDAGLLFSNLRQETTPALFDLLFNMTELNGRILGSLYYDIGLFEESFIERLLKQFETVLVRMSADVDLSLERTMEILAEQDRLLLEESAREMARVGLRKLKNLRGNRHPAGNA